MSLNEGLKSTTSPQKGAPSLTERLRQLLDGVSMSTDYVFGLKDVAGGRNLTGITYDTEQGVPSIPISDIHTEDFTASTIIGNDLLILGTNEKYELLKLIRSKRSENPQNTIHILFHISPENATLRDRLTDTPLIIYPGQPMDDIQNLDDALARLNNRCNFSILIKNKS